MGAKIQIKGTDQIVDVPRGSAIPKQGETLVIIQKGTQEEVLYQVYLVEHTLDFNNRMGIINTLITVEELNAPTEVFKDEESDISEDE